MRTLSALLASLLFLVASPLPAQSLAERRAVEAYKTGPLVSLQQELDKAAGYPLPIEAQWDKIAVPGQADRMQDADSYWTAVFVRPLIAAIQQVGKDQMGKDALRAGLKKVVLTYDEATAPAANYPNGLSFENGVLTINFVPGVNVHDEKPRTDAIVAVLESKL